jgi:hypothetical protein
MPLMTEDDAPEAEAAWDALEAGLTVRFDLPRPCSIVENGLICGVTEAYIRVRPYGSSFHYARRCANNHFVDNVKHAVVELAFGITKTGTPNNPVAQDALTPPKRVAFNVSLRDKFRCVYCGRGAGEEQLDGSVVVITADHIIAKGLINAEDIRRDRELLMFARDLQLVTACQSHNSSKATTLLPLEDARELFIRHVLGGQTRGTNLGMVSTFDRLYRIVALNLRLEKR